MQKSLKRLATGMLGGAIALAVGGAMAQAAHCTATAQAATFTYNPGELSPQFRVTVKGCAGMRASTGRLDYSARVVDFSNREDTLTKLDAKWMGREGASFTFAPSGVTRVPAGQVADVREITDVNVLECACVD